MNKKLAGLLIAFGPMLGLLFVILLFGFLCPPQFSTFYNAKTILTQMVIIGIGALGMTLVIISGGIDLSVGSQVALCTVVLAGMLNVLVPSGGSSVGMVKPFIAAIAGVVACGLCGWITGMVISKIKIVPFIVTLGMMLIARGTAKWIGREQTVITPPNWIQKIMMVDPEPSWLIFAPGVWLCMLLLVLLFIVLKYTVFGRYTFAIGSNEQTARLCGINVERQRIMVYTLCGIFTGIAGVMQYANLTVGDPTAANGMELDIIAAVVMGGGSLSGGEGSAQGSIIGALIMAVLRNGCNMLGVRNYLQDIIIGTIIVCAALVDKLRHRMK